MREYRISWTTVSVSMPVRSSFLESFFFLLWDFTWLESAGFSSGIASVPSSSASLNKLIYAESDRTVLNCKLTASIFQRFRLFNSQAIDGLSHIRPAAGQIYMLHINILDTDHGFSSRTTCISDRSEALSTWPQICSLTLPT